MPSARLFTAAALATALLAPAAAIAAPADPDPAFGDGGTARVTVPGSASLPADLALAPGNGLLAAGSAGDGVAVVRLAADGRPVAGFGAGGVLTAPLAPAVSEALAISAAGDGTFALGGSWADVPTTRRWLASRHGADGAPAAAFGGDGVGTIDGTSRPASDVVLLPAGGVLLAGASTNRFSSAQLARLRPDGTPDPAFGVDGVVEAARQAPAPNEGFDRVLVEPDGAIVAAGFTSAQGGPAGRLLLSRFSASGQLDPAFAANGSVVDASHVFTVRGLVRQADGKLVVAGGADDRFFVARYTAAGAPDPAFGTGGMWLGPDGTAAAGVALGPDGTIVVAGRDAAGERAVARLLADGTPDPAFGTAGVARLGAGSVAGVEVDGAGRIAVLGTETGAPGVWTVTRLLGAAPAPSSGDDGDGDSGSSGSSGDGSAPAAPALPLPAPAPVTGVAESQVPVRTFAVRLLSQRVRRDGSLRVQLRYPAGFRGRLAVRLTLAGSPKVVLGTRTVTVGRGASLAANVKLTARGRRVLARPGAARVRVSVRRVAG